MTAPANTCCTPWATAADVDACGSRFSGIEPYILEDALADASDLLWRKSGKRWPGVCTVTLRPPCEKSGYWRPQWANVRTDWWSLGGYAGFGCCECLPRGVSCGCGPTQIMLGRTPVVAVVEVVVDGDVLVEGTDYRVDDWRWLVRLPDSDGQTRTWPASQNMGLALTEEDTWGYTISYGANPPPSGVRAAARLAGELALDRCGGDCQLPQGLTNLNRQGVSVSVLNDPDIWTNLPRAVRLFLDSVPNITRGATIWSPDLSPPHVRPDVP